MATVPLTPFVPNASLADPAGTASDAANVVSAAGAVEEIVLRAEVITAASDVTVKAGDNPPAFGAGVGDLVTNCPIGVTFVGPFTSARFGQLDGTLLVDVATPANVTLTAFRLPRTA